MDSSNENDIQLRNPQLEDGKAVYDLIRSSPPLDLNSAYNYFLLCSHFADTCVIGESGGRIVSFLSAYRLPRAPETLFIWQVAVDGSMRGKRMAGRMLDELLSRPACSGVKYLETTVSPSNAASKRVFEKFAKENSAAWHEEVFLSREQFGGEDHEEEILFQIGPFELK